MLLTYCGSECKSMVNIGGAIVALTDDSESSMPPPGVETAKEFVLIILVVYLSFKVHTQSTFPSLTQIHYDTEFSLRKRF